MRVGMVRAGIALIVCAAALAVCGGERTVAYKELGYQITYPETSSGVTIETAVRDLKEDDSLRSFFKNQGYQYWLNTQTLTDIRMVKLDGRSAFKMTTVSNPRQNKCQCVLYYTVANSRGYALWLRGTEANFEKHAKEIEAMMASFKILTDK